MERDIKYEYGFDVKNNKKIHINDYVNGVDECVCFGCNEPFVAIQNSKHMADHYKHKAKSNCNYQPMTKWHEDWQNLFALTEMIFDRRRADVFIRTQDLVIEFQHSPIKAEETISRTNDYMKEVSNVVWLFDKIDKSENIFYSEWKYMDKKIIELYKNTKAHIFLETDKEILKIVEVSVYDKTGKVKTYFKWQVFTKQEFIIFCNNVNFISENKYYKYESVYDYKFDQHLNINKKNKINMYNFLTNNNEHSYYINKNNYVYVYKNGTDKWSEHKGGIIFNRNVVYKELIETQTIIDYLEKEEKTIKEKLKIRDEENRELERLNKIKKEQSKATRDYTKNGVKIISDDDEVNNWLFK